MSSALIQLLVRELRISERAVNQLIASAPERYKVYHIKKRRGGRREIAQPAFEVKVAQKVLMEEVLSKLPVHPAATAYRDGSSIRKNAAIHANVNGPILKYDFKDFFPSITAMSWVSYCEAHHVMDRDDAIRAGRILFRRPKGGRILRLSIGAPSSPMLSNIMLFEFDQEISRRVERHKITYTRYADDIVFSAERTGNLSVVDGILRSVLNNITSPRLTLNSDKTVLATKKFHRQVTGLVLSNDGAVSLGRDRKRRIRAALHHYKLGKLDKAAAVKLAGTLAFAKDAEPGFHEAMQRVYGAQLIEHLKLEVRGYKRPVGNSFVRRLG